MPSRRRTSGNSNISCGSVAKRILWAVAIASGSAVAFIILLGEAQEFISKYPQMSFLLEKPFTFSVLVGILFAMIITMIFIFSGKYMTATIFTLIPLIAPGSLIMLMFFVETTSLPKPCCMPLCMIESTSNIGIWMDDRVGKQKGVLKPGHQASVLYHNNNMNDLWWLIEISNENRAHHFITMYEGYENNTTGWVNSIYVSINDAIACHDVTPVPDRQIKTQ